MTALLDRVPADEIMARGRQVRFSRVLTTLLLGLFFALGWLAGRAWLAAADAVIAVRLGWQQGRGQVPAAGQHEPGAA